LLITHKPMQSRRWLAFTSTSNSLSSYKCIDSIHFPTNALSEARDVTNTQKHTQTQAHTQNTQAYTKHTNTNTHSHRHTHIHTPSFNLRKIWDIKVTIKEAEV